MKTGVVSPISGGAHAGAWALARADARALTRAAARALARAAARALARTAPRALTRTLAARVDSYNHRMNNVTNDYWKWSNMDRHVDGKHTVQTTLIVVGFNITLELFRA